MVKAITVCTDEVDDIEYAVADITKKLAAMGGLMKNSIGIISCYSDFVDTGVCKAVCEALPFETAGTTTIDNMVSGGEGEILLTLTVLTSDDACFTTGLTGGITEEDTAPFEKAYKSAAEKLCGEPKMMLSFAPLLMNISGDFYATAFDKASGGLPNFGTLAVDHHEDYSNQRVIHNGEAYADRYAFILLGGNVSPKFYVAGISAEKVFQDKGLVTASHGNQLASVNNMPVKDYLISLGLKLNADGTISGINSFPFIIDFGDGGTPVIRATFAITPDGHAVCGGNIPVGSIISVGSIDADEVLKTTEAAVAAAKADGSKCLIMFSCVGRYFSLGYNPASEMDKVRQVLGDDVTYALAYSGGELCPVYINNTDAVKNKNHNDTLIICAL